ncbi:MAG: hypothetical protein ACOYEA_05690 [Fermentimonas sp.]|jgi:hypothetical protein
MKRISIYLSVVFSVLLLCACNKSSNKNSSDDGNTTGQQTSQTQTQAQTISSDQLHDILMESFSPDWIEREADPQIYPAYYGGSYTDSNGTFVVAVTSDAQQNEKRLAEILGTTDFKVQTVKYSYRDMMVVMEKIDQFLQNNSETDDSLPMQYFAGAYPDIPNNRVVVKLTSINDNVVNSFKRDVVNSPLVHFQKQADIPQLN